MPEPSTGTSIDTGTDRLAAHTTLRLGGPAERFVRAASSEEIVAAVRAEDEAGAPVLVLGGGSNLVVADAGFAGTVVALTPPADPIRVEQDEQHATVTVAAGVPWDALVARAVAEGWVGIEALSGIPGTVGATPVQNVGAYGQEVAQTIASVRVWDRRERREVRFAAADCGFGYRTSRFKTERYDAAGGRHTVLDVTFRFPRGTTSAPVGYAELARTLAVEVGGTAPAAEVRSAVLGLRAGKGMVLDPGDHDTWSAGSFFTNPIVDPERVPAGAPSYRQPDGTVKTSAAWLIDHAGFAKGYRAGSGRAGLSTKHTLALTNRGAASTEDLLALAREIRDGVARRFGITLVNEPVLLGCRL
ncbi:UDP-N-acetylmuramate dehydrogenase [Nocardioides sambongensis]|uniref:UDP-N-acetylmuramate dehydrogenase n=1 Tax=Nocardioides sambongensis TaxID=2589074 RepID=UPI001E3BCF63|nr:UDP-N-acetylmuramate dehydrogenase [Nocardioides sambongensis]